MNNSKFNIIFNNILSKIEEHLDHYNNVNHMDYETTNQIMIISFSKKNKIIISKQEALKQIWLANKTNGYHFNYKDGNWICNKSKKNFWYILQKSFYIYGQEKINFTNQLNKK